MVRTGDKWIAAGLFAEQSFTDLNVLLISIHAVYRKAQRSASTALDEPQVTVQSKACWPL